jgi:dTDP-4-amino-4,6-dideoxygalactose transaminase
MISINEPLREYMTLSASIESAVLSAMRGGRWFYGPATEAFASAFACYIGVGHVLPVGNGTDALELALRAVGIGSGDEVITAPNAGGYSTIACRAIGADPVYADIREDDCTLDPKEVKPLLSPRVKAVVMTHLYGNLGDISGIRAELSDAGREDVVIIEDCAQAHGARRSGRIAGSLGDIATFSFYPSKNLGALGDAGAVVTDREDLAQRVKLLHQYGWEQRYRSVVPYGRNSRMDEIQAAILGVKLTFLDEMNRARRNILQTYREVLPPGYRFCALEGEETVAHLAVLDCTARGEASDHFAKNGIRTDIHYPVLDCDQPAAQKLSMRSSNLLRARRTVKRILTLPCYPYMTSGEVATVCAALKSLPLPSNSNVNTV